ncbi:MAG: hypothetical protein GF320_10250 [Armatimonadia bacterium]|nr:hypothetical protein [Armatimonadia bacterium]
MTALLLVLAVLPPYNTPGTSDRVATVQLAGTPSGALVEIRAPDSEAWIVGGIVPGFVAVHLEMDGFYSFRYRAPGHSPAARVIHLREGDQARLELNLSRDAREPVFHGTWLGFIHDGDIRAVRMVAEGRERPQRVLVGGADAKVFDWLPDGRVLYQRAGDGALVLTDLDAGASQETRPAGEFRLIQGHPDGLRALGLDGSGRPVLCFLETGEVELVGPDDASGGWAALSPKGDRVAMPAPIEDEPGDVAIYELAGGRLVSRVRWEGRAAPPGEGEFIGGGDRLLLVPYLGGESSKMRLLNRDADLLWVGPDSLRRVRAHADGIHFAARTDDREPRIVFGMLGSEAVIEVAEGASPDWGPAP